MNVAKPKRRLRLKPIASIRAQLDQEERTVLTRRDVESNHRLNRLFSVLLLAQMVIAVVLAVMLTPRAWNGVTASIHIHVWGSIVLGGLLGIVPAYAGWFHSTNTWTRYIISTAQVGYSGLFIHISGGHPETHFHVFASLAFISLYRDPGTLIAATAVVAVDHLARALFWPMSVFGISDPALLRALEHAMWVIIEDSVLFVGIVQARRDTALVIKQQVAASRSNAILLESIGQLRPAFDRATKGDLSSKIPVVADPMVEQLGSDFEQTLDAWSHVIETVIQSVANITGTSTHLQDSSKNLASGIEQQTNSLTGVQTSLDALCRSIDDIRQRTLEVTKSSEQASAVASTGTVAMEESERAMNEIQSSSDCIAKAVSVIQDLADQTAMLALNATIEAARAGAAGKGFSIVANEVKELAQRSNESANEIALLIDESRQKVSQGVAAGIRTSAQFRQICAAVQLVQAEMTEIMTDTQTQSDCASKLASALDTLRSINLHNDKNGRQVSEEGNQLDSLAKQLTECVSQFKIVSVTEDPLTHEDGPEALPSSVPSAASGPYDDKRITINAYELAT